MIKLKAILATPHPKMKNACDGAIEVYPKSEVDAAIAELKGQVNGFKNRANLWLYNAQNEHNAAVAVRMENAKLKAKLAEKDKKIDELKEQYKDMDVTHTVHIAKMNAKIEELEESQRWRKFSEEKPEKREVVFVRMSDGLYRIAMYLARGLGWDIGDGAHHKSEEVTHWMPLPKTLEEDK